MVNSPTVRLVVEEFGTDPRVVTELLSLAPTNISTVGWAADGKTVGQNQISWVFDLPENRSKTLENRFVALVAVLKQKKAGVGQVNDRFNARIIVTATEADSTRIDERAYFGRFQMPPTLIACLNELGIAVEIQFMFGFKESPIESDA